MADSPDTDHRVNEPSAADVLSVTELNKQIASVVEQTAALHSVKCIGEVTNLSQSNTALYFMLTDGDAELPYLLWVNRYQHLGRFGFTE